jgi:hypothetical protein
MDNEAGSCSEAHCSFVAGRCLLLSVCFKSYEKHQSPRYVMHIDSSFLVHGCYDYI